MERDLWEQAQRQLRDQAARCKTRATKAGPSPLAGKLFDEDSECLYVAGAAKGERRYRYYVSRRLVTGSADKVRNGWRLSAPEIERTVAVACVWRIADLSRKSVIRHTQVTWAVIAAVMLGLAEVDVRLEQPSPKSSPRCSPD